MTNIDWNLESLSRGHITKKIKIFEGSGILNIFNRYVMFFIETFNLKGSHFVLGNSNSVASPNIVTPKVIVRRGTMNVPWDLYIFSTLKKAFNILSALWIEIAALKTNTVQSLTVIIKPSPTHLRLCILEEIKVLKNNTFEDNETLLCRQQVWSHPLS